MVLAALAVLAGAFVQSATGFGFALILSPALFAMLEPVEAVNALLALGFALNLLILFERGRQEHVDWRALAPMLVASIPGFAVGALAVTRFSKEPLQVTVGVAVMLAAAWQLRERRRHERRPLPPAAAWPVGFASGALTTSLSVSGPPIALWLEARGVAPAEFRATLSASFLALNAAGAGVLAVVEGSVEFEEGTVLPLLGLVAVGYLLGARAFRRLDHRRFFGVVLALVAGSGAASIVAGLA